MDHEEIFAESYKNVKMCKKDQWGEKGADLAKCERNTTHDRPCTKSQYSNVLKKCSCQVFLNYL